MSVKAAPDADHDHRHKQQNNDSNLSVHAAIASVGVALFLVAIKGYATAQTGSVAMLASLADTGLDLVASLVTLFAVRYAMRPADSEHRFGHGKAEALSAMFQVMLITASAIVIGYRAIARLQDGENAARPEYGIIVSVIAIVVTIGLLAYQRMVIRRTGSVAIHADHVHYQTDLLLNLAVIAALVLDVVLELRGADAFFGIAIALWLLRGGWNAASNAMDHLMDREWPDKKRQRFIDIAMTHPELKDMHDLRTRSSGPDDFVQFHVSVDGDMTVAAAHKVMDEVEAKLMKQFPGVEILIHPDPEGLVQQEGGEIAQPSRAPRPDIR